MLDDNASCEDGDKRAATDSAAYRALAEILYHSCKKSRRRPGEDTLAASQKLFPGKSDSATETRQSES